MDEREQLITLCRKLGAPEGQAAAMADQLLKRCEQLARTRGISPPEAMNYLLNLLVKGAQGEAPPGFEGGPPPQPETR